MSHSKYRKEKDCLNCGHIVEDKFCTQCGQENLELKESAFHMIVHAIADYFHFDSKFTNTMKPLLIQPGILTREYINGKRASFLHPVKLYIFISILFFIFVFSSDSDSTRVIDKNLDKTEKVTDRALKNDSLLRVSLAKPAQLNPADIHPTDTTYEAYVNRTNLLKKEDQPGIIEKLNNKAKINYKGKDKVKVFAANLVKNTPKMMFVLLPLFAFFLYLFHASKTRYYFEDLIYSFHVHALIFLTLLISKTVIYLFGFFINVENLVGFIVWIYLTWYIYRSMRVFYGESRWKTIIKMFLLSVLYMLLLGICATVMAILTILFFG